MIPQQRLVTGNTICPAFGVSQRGLAYNLKTDTFYAGSWNDSTIYEFDRSGTILRSVNVGLPIAGLAFNPATDHLFVMNNTTSVFQVTLVDVLDNFRPRLQFSIPGFSPSGGAGLAMDCDGYLWATDQKAGIVYQVTSGETSDCSVLRIPWLTETPVSGNAAAHSSPAITLDFNAAGFGPGETHQGYLIVETDTPYGSLYVPVTMHVMNLPVVAEVTKQTAMASTVVDPGCQATEYYFEYGTVEGVYDQRTASIFSSSCSPVTIEALLEGLKPGTRYSIRLVAVNGSGVVASGAVSFLTDKFPWLLMVPAISAKPPENRMSSPAGD